MFRGKREVETTTAARIKLKGEVRCKNNWEIETGQ